MLDFTAFISVLFPPQSINFPKSINLAFDYQDGAPKVEMDPQQLHRSSLNLMVNARDAVNEEGDITIRVSTHDVEMRVSVGERRISSGINGFQSH